MGDTTALFGNTGEGKTFTLTLLALMAKANGRSVFLNNHVVGINCPAIIRGGRPEDYNKKFGGLNDPNRVTKDYYLKYGQYYLPDPEVLIMKTRTYSFPRNSLVCIDEAYAWGLDARESMGGATESKKSRLALTHAILQSRKSHFNISHTEQLIKSIDNRLRFLTEIYVLMEGISYRYIDGERVNVEFKLSPFQNLGVWGFKQLPPLFIREPIFWALNSCYDTYEQITIEEEALIRAEGNSIRKEAITPVDPKEDSGESFTI